MAPSISGVTSDLVRRIYEHKTDAVDGFTRKYGVHKLVYFESTEDVRVANSARADDEEMKSRMEAGADRERQSGLD